MIPSSLSSRLYLADAHLLHFSATVIERSEIAGRPSVILNQSAFYPEAGGQPADLGTLGGARVLDVQVDERGRVHHVVDGEIEGDVQGVVDGRRRDQFRSLHSAQHMLSRALMVAAGSETKSARLSARGASIDLDKKIGLAAVKDAIAQCNEIVREDREIRAYFPTPTELRAANLRSPPKVANDIRLVEIDGFDITPCGGTHASSTAQIGLISLAQLDSAKGKSRVHFVSGALAGSYLQERADIVFALCQDFTCGVQEVRSNVQKQRAELKALRKRLGDLQAKQVEVLIAQMNSELMPDACNALLLGVGSEHLGKISAELTKEGARVLALIAKVDGGHHVAIARGPDAKCDVGALFAKLANALGGKGGGRDPRAAGRFLGASFDDIEKAFADLCEQS